ncbi:MAG: hypothetical protein Fur0022_03150 [Anaerolineales bacterium]
MPETIITSLTDVTPTWLTEVLTKSGALRHGAVTTFEVDKGRGNWSANARLTLAYTLDAQGTLPQNLFLKMVNTDLEDEFFGASEVTYYTRDYVDVPDAPLIRCYTAAYSEELRRYHLLLDDVSQTHVEAATKAPSLEFGLALAEGLAALHARWWGANRLTEAHAPIHSPKHIQAFSRIAEPGLPYILEHFSTSLKPHWPEMLQTFFARFPQTMIARAQNPEGFTLIHGDVGPYNILVPRAGVRPLYLIDRQPFDWSLTTWLGVYDLAYAMVLDWDIEARREWELPVLRHYHTSLRHRGIETYSWEQLFDDYRLCLAMGIYIAVEYCRGEDGARRVDVWLPMLQRSLTACDDLNYTEL